MKSIFEKSLFLVIVFVISGCFCHVLQIDLKEDNSLVAEGDFFTYVKDGVLGDEARNFITYLTDISASLGIKMTYLPLYTIKKDKESSNFTQYFRIRLTFSDISQLNKLMKKLETNPVDDRLTEQFDFTLDPKQNFVKETVWGMKFSLTPDAPFIGLNKALTKKERGRIIFNMPGELKSWEPMGKHGNYEVKRNQNSLTYFIDTSFYESDERTIDIEVVSHEMKIIEPVRNSESIVTEVTTIDNSQKNEIDNSKKTEIKNFYPQAESPSKSSPTSLPTDSGKKTTLDFSVREIILLCTAILGFLTAWLTFINKRRKKDDDGN